YEGDARILNAPDFFRIVFWVGHQCGFTINLPPIDAVFRASGTQMRQATPVFDPAEEQSGPIGQQGRTGVEHTVDGVRPILAREDGIARVPQKQRRVVRVFDIDKGCFRSRHEGSFRLSGASLSGRGSEAARISRRAVRKDSVDSAPWF